MKTIKMESVARPTPAMLFSIINTACHLLVLSGPCFPAVFGMGATNTQLMRIHNQSQLYHISHTSGARPTSSSIINTYFNKDNSIFFKPKTKIASERVESKHYVSSSGRKSMGNVNLGGSVHHMNIHVDQNILSEDKSLYSPDEGDESHSQPPTNHKNLEGASLQDSNLLLSNNSSSTHSSSFVKKTQKEPSHASYGKEFITKHSANKETTSPTESRLCNTTGYSERLDMEFTSTVVDNGKFWPL